VSYGRLAAIDRNDVQSSPGVTEVVKVVGHALEPLGRVGRTEESFDGGLTAYSVGEGRNIVGVVVNHRDLTIKLGWNRVDNSGFVSQVQTAIEREFAAKYHTDLRFEAVPCGWFGP